MQPVNAQNLVSYGESFNRIGPTKRSNPYTELKHIEDLILKHSALTASADIMPCQPPNFTEFTYADLLGGMTIRTFSAEINLRMNMLAPQEEIPQELIDTFMSGLKDKYQLKTSKDYNYKRVVFPPGHNAFDRMVDSQQLFRMMDEDKSLMIKPHPITNDALLKNLGNSFGYSRIIDKSESAFSVMKNCEEVITTVTSELSLVAILLDKKMTDISSYTQSWAGLTSSILPAVKHDKQKLLSVMLGSKSGFMLPSMSEAEIITRINNYCEYALELRKPFEMLSSQRLIVSMPKVMEPPKPQEKEPPK